MKGNMENRTSMQRAADAEESMNMRCWHCKEDLIWGGDFDYEDYGLEGEGIVSNFSCSNCESTAEVYMPFDEDR